MTQQAVATTVATIDPPSITVPSNDDAPVRRIDSDALRQLGMQFDRLFVQYRADRRLAELRWLRNQRQYLGVYDPEVEQSLNTARSRAYPRLTRVKCISVLSRLMNLMFQGNERNWELKAAPWPDMTTGEVKEAIALQQQKDQAAGAPTQQPDLEYVMAAVKDYAQNRAKVLSDLIDDQLQELGGDQSEDYVALNRKALQSGILYGLGVLRGPFVRETDGIIWNTSGPVPMPKRKTVYKPVFEWLPVWDFYPDMSAKRFKQMDGYFIRQVMSRAQVLALKDKPGFFATQIMQYLNRNTVGNYRPDWYETELRAMGVKANVNEQKIETTKYEVVVYHGKISGQLLSMAGCTVSPDKYGLEIDAELWMIDGNVIKADTDAWADLGVEMTLIHEFLFDEDDTSPIGFGLPNAVRDSQMAISAATRMLLDNASVVCGPNLELNTDLLRLDQDLEAISAYKIWYRTGTGPEAQWPAVRNVQIDAHMDSLLKIIDTFMKFADMETFVGPATGGDMSQAPSEPLRTAAGASMLRSDQALPFKDMIRAFDRFTQSVILSLVRFNRKFNPDLAPDGDYDVIARGATSLMAKELRGMQADELVRTLTPEDEPYVDRKKLLSARLRARDMDDIMPSDTDIARRLAQQGQQQQQQQDQQNRMVEANVRKVLSDAFKGITQGQKNTAAADADTVNSVIALLEKGIMHGLVAPSLPDPASGAQPAPNDASGTGGALSPGGAFPASGGQPAQPGLGGGQGPAGAGGPGLALAASGGGPGV
jgi:hypothetical protein